MATSLAWKRGHGFLCRAGDALKQNVHVCECACVSPCQHWTTMQAMKAATDGQFAPTISELLTGTFSDMAK